MHCTYLHYKEYCASVSTIQAKVLAQSVSARCYATIQLLTSFRGHDCAEIALGVNISVIQHLPSSVQSDSATLSRSCQACISRRINLPKPYEVHARAEEVSTMQKNASASLRLPEYDFVKLLHSAAPFTSCCKQASRCMNCIVLQLSAQSAAP
jgi:hypothetical protein